MGRAQQRRLLPALLLLLRLLDLVLLPAPAAPLRFHQPPAAAIVHVDTTRLAARISPRFKCWNIDASPNRGFLHRNLSSPGLLQLAKGLPAGYLRFGGSGNDALWYGVGSANSCAGAAPRNFNCLNATMVGGLLALAEAASARLVFGLNIADAGCPRGPNYSVCLHRPGRQWNGSTSWNSTNAEGLIRYLAARGQPYAYELGNEENSHYPERGLSPAQEVQSFAKLAAILAEVYPDPGTRPKILGPDADYQDSDPAQRTIYKQWAGDFLGNLSQRKVPLLAATLHEYIQVGWNGSLWTSLDPAVLDKTASCADDFRDLVRSTSQRVGLSPQPEIWAGEIGPHNGGSPPCTHSSMRWANFANSFWYMDAMATKAAHGFSVFCRQDFIGAPRSPTCTGSLGVPTMQSVCTMH
jgi:heparanase 1